MVSLFEKTKVDVIFLIISGVKIYVLAIWSCTASTHTFFKKPYL